MTPIPRTVPHHFAAAAERLGDRPVLEDRAGTVGFHDLLRGAAALAEGLARMGVKPGDRVGFAADNSRRWILSDLAIHAAGAISVPRGTDTTIDELVEIFRHAEVGVVLAHDARTAAALEGVRGRVPTMREIVCLDPAGAPGPTVDALQAVGASGPSFAERAKAIRPDAVATIIYTSGTTGRPKGVVLTQSNFGHQIEVLPGALGIRPREEAFLSILPPWHIFERTVEYVALTSGCRLCYTDRRRFKEDFARYRPTFVPSVPRVWETVYSGIVKALKEGSPVRRAVFRGAYAVAAARAKAWDRARGVVLRARRPRGVGLVGEAFARGGALLVALLTFLPDRLAHLVVFRRIRKVTGDRLIGSISGGGLLPPHLDVFFRSIGLPILIGYGLTETSPVVTVRRAYRNVLGSIGVAIPEVDLQIRHLETHEVLAPGEVGVIFTRGPQVMRGYHKDDALTRAAVDPEGWFDTGDLGWMTEEGDLCFSGRAKETIVLSGGENVEPTRVESALLTSPLIEQAIVVGQDRKTLGALILPAPEPVSQALGHASPLDRAALAAHADAKERLRREAISLTERMKPEERVTRIALMPEPLDPSNGLLTQTLKPKRHAIVERFRAAIEEMYAS